MPTVEDVQAAFGIEPTGESESSEDQVTEGTPSADVSEEADVNESDDNSSAEGAGESSQEPDQEQQQFEAQNNFNQQKQNQAFARMRTENAQMQKAMAMMAQVLGVNPNQPMDQLAAQLQSQAMGAIAKANNMDPAILQRLDQLEAINAEYTRVKLENEVTNTLNNIGAKYGATEDDLVAFVETLIEDGYDVAAPGADIESEFIKRNFSAINQRSIDKAIQAEQHRSAKGSGASKPLNKQGQEDNSETHDINTVEDLDKFFSDNLK